MLSAAVGQAHTEASKKRSDAVASRRQTEMAGFMPGNQSRLRTLADRVAVQRPSRMPMLARKCGCGGTCADCGQKDKLQRKAAISEPGNAFEEEADRVADQVMRMPAAGIESKRTGGSDGSDNGSRQASPRMQRLANERDNAGQLASEFPSDLGAGAPLDPASRAWFEPRFGHDFGHVRIHDGPQADRAAASLRARAFTLGPDVVFAAGEYQPTSRMGRRLIAHELTHVVQNHARESMAGRTPSIEPPLGLAEVEAHRAGTRAALGLTARSVSARNSGVALTPASDQIVPLLSYSWNDWAVTADDERQVLGLLRVDPDLSATIVDLNTAGMLDELLERIDEPAHRRDLLRLLGAGLNSAARTLVEPLIQDMGVNRGPTEGSQIQYNLGRIGVKGRGAAFDPGGYRDLISGDSMAAFTGVGATGVNPTERGYGDWLGGAGLNAFDDHINPIGGLGDYLDTLSADQRRRQVELLVRQPISTNFADSYAGELPSRLQVIQAGADANRLEPELVTAIILAEQRDQSQVEDARDFIGGFVLGRNTSVGLGQVLPSTARRNDLFSDLLTNRASPMAHTTARANINPSWMIRVLASDELNIVAVARYIRVVADDGATRSIATLPKTKKVFPGIDLAAYAKHSSAWPVDNVGALGMYYTSRAWTDSLDSAGWGWFVMQAYADVKAAKVF
jgi:hypothetical protein